MKDTFYALWTIFLTISILYFGKAFLIPITLSIFFRLIMSYQVLLLTKKVSYKKSITIVLSSYILLLVGSFYVLWASAAYINEKTNSLLSQVGDAYSSYEMKVRKNTFITMSQINDWKEQWKELLTLDNVWWIAWWTLQWLTTGILIFFLSIFLLLTEKRIIYWLQETVWNQGKDIVDIARKTVAEYCFWLLLLVGILFIFNTIGLLIFWVPYAPLIGWFSALAAIIPMVWTIIWWIAATLASWFLTWSLFVWIWIFVWYIVVQQIDEYFITPKVVGESVSLNHLASLLSLIAWWILWWVAWLFLAIPIMWVIKKILDKGNHPFSIFLANDKL